MKYTESSYKKVARTWDVILEANRIVKALKVIVAAAHGKKATDVLDATKIVENTLIKDKRIVDIMIAASDRRAHG
jgi:DNA-binding protein